LRIIQFLNNAIPAPFERKLRKKLIISRKIGKKKTYINKEKNAYSVAKRGKDKIVLELSLSQHLMTRGEAILPLTLAMHGEKTNFLTR